MPEGVKCDSYNMLIKAFIAAVVFHGLLAHASFWSCFHNRKRHSNLEDGDDILVINDRSLVHLEPCQQLWMEMYAANSQAPESSTCRGNDAYSVLHFTINDGGSSSCQSPLSEKSISRILGRAILVSFSRTSDWRSSMRSAIKIMQECGASGSTTALVVRKVLLTNRNVVAVYNLGDSRVALLRQSKSTNLYKVHSLTQAQKTSEGPLRISGIAPLNDECKTYQMEEYNFNVENDDLIVAASNGLWDVVEVSEIALLANRVGLDALALSLVKLAQASDRKPNDDVTVVVAHITHQPPSQSTFDMGNCESLGEQNSCQPVLAQKTTT